MRNALKVKTVKHFDMTLKKNARNLGPFGKRFLETLFVFFGNMWVKKCVKIYIMLFKH